METIANQLITALDTINKLTNELSKLKTAHIILNNKYAGSVELINKMETIVNELHRPIRKVPEYRKVIVYRVNEIWACDLVQMDKFNDENNGYKYILTCIDLYSRYAWVRPLKTKNAIEVKNAIESSCFCL